MRSNPGRNLHGVRTNPRFVLSRYQGHETDRTPVRLRFMEETSRVEIVILTHSYRAMPNPIIVLIIQGLSRAEAPTICSKMCFLGVAFGKNRA